MKKSTSYVMCTLAGLIVATTLIRAQSAATEASGLIVEAVNADSPAARAGLRVADKLVAFNERPMTSLAALQAIQQNSIGRKESVLSVRRGEQTLTLNIPTTRLGVILRPELPATALPLYMKAKEVQQTEKTAEEISFWIKAAIEAENDGDKIAASWLYWSAGLIYENQENWEEAKKVHASAWKAIEGSRDAAAQVKVMESIGWCSRNLKNYPASQRWYEQALQVNTVAGYEIWAAADLTYLGRNALSTRDFPAAQNFFDRALKIYERLTPDSVEVVTSLALLGGVAYFRSDFEVAQNHFQRALDIGKPLNQDPEDVARILDSLGSVVYLRGDLAAAEGYYSKALEIRRQEPDGALNVAGTLNNLGNVAYFQGDLLSAQKYYREARDIYKLLAPRSRDYAASLNNLGGVFYSANNTEEAEKNYGQALDIWERLDPDTLDVALALNNLGNVAYIKKDLAAAKDYHRRALELRQRLAPGSLDVADSLGNLATIAHVDGELKTAEDYNRRALKIREQLAPGSLKYAASLANLGSSVFKRGRFPEALQLFTDAVNVIEAQRTKISSIEARAFFTARYTYAYIGLLETNLALNDLPAAFAVVERARARSLIELLSERQLNFQNDVPPDLLKQQVQLNRDRSTTYSALTTIAVDLNAVRLALQKSERGGDPELIEKLKKQNRDFEGRIEELRVRLITISVRQREVDSTVRRDSRKFASLNYPEPLDLKGAQAALDADTLLLSYFVGIEKTYLLAITKNSTKVFTLPIGGNALKDRVRSFRTDVANKRVDTSNLMQQGKNLYDLLIAPAQDEVNQAKRILICPDGSLNTLPFASLVRYINPTPRYFIEDKPMHTVNSMTLYATMLKLNTGNGQQQKKLLAFGDAVNNLPALKWSRREVQAIGGLFGQSATIKLGPQATETIARQESKDYSILHFAVHGSLDSDVGLNSSLVLTQPGMPTAKASENDNGLWQAWEIFEQARLKADLVVLSACEAGSGENVQGEGLIGLTRAFQYAGAKSLVVSLWSIDDESTATFMTAFYQELRKGASKDIALQKAMVTVRNQPKWQHPSHWSPFILVGGWR